MKKIRLVIFVLLSILIFISLVYLKLKPKSLVFKENEISVEDQALLRDGMNALKERKDELALEKFSKILAGYPDNLESLWGKAEALRRKREYKQAELVLNKILQINSRHLPSLNSLSYIKYKNGDFKNAVLLAKKVLSSSNLDRENQAMAFMLLGAINSARAENGSLLGKCIYAGKIKGNFLKAKELAPNLPEVRLALGTFYILAPKIIGGDLERGLSELQEAVKLAPAFATINARLAQGYKIKGDSNKFEYYLAKARSLDPENEVLKEMKEE